MIWPGRRPVDTAAPGRWFERPGPVLALLAAWLLLSVAWRPLMLPDEGRYAGVAFELLSDGQWATPTLFGLPYFHKPPLMYWIAAAAMALTDGAPWAARIAPALGGWLMGAALWWHARRQADATMAGGALLLLAGTPFFFVGAQFANHDMLVAGWITVAVVAARAALETRGRRWCVTLALAWGAAGMAMLSKGLIGLVLPALAIAPWLLLQGRWRDLLRLLHPVGALTLLAIVLPWALAMERLHPGFFDYFVVEQHFRRYAGQDYNNPQPFWFYLVALPLLTLPASLAVVHALRGAWRRARAAGPDEEALFLLCWLAAVLLFFSLPRSKLVGYVLPALPPLVLLLAPVWRGWRARRVMLTLAGLSCLALVAALAWKGPRDHADLAAELGARIAPGERVVLIGDPYFDLRLLAKLDRPPIVVEDWSGPQAQREDNWRRELRDAGRFDPQGAQAVLWTPERWATERCRPGSRWWVVATASKAAAAGLDASTRIHGGARGELHHLRGCR